ncbi:MAG: hypothetical protein ACXVHR_05590 [Methanobacterium sp.]
MNKYLKIVFYGFLVWLIPFAVSFVIFPLKAPMYPLFESILSVVIAIAAVLLSYFYLKAIESNYIIEGIKIGLAWFIINVAIDLLIFMPASPMQMNFADYIMGIGPKYLIIPAITIGMGYLAKDKTANFKENE